MDNIHAKLVMVSMLLDRANKAFEKSDGNTFELNKADYNDSLRMARRLIAECYVDQEIVMNYKQMWLTLKDVINKEIDILHEEKKKASTSLLVEELEAQYNEADYLAGEMEEIEEKFNGNNSNCFQLGVLDFELDRSSSETELFN